MNIHASRNTRNMCQLGGWRSPALVVFLVLFESVLIAQEGSFPRTWERHASFSKGLDELDQCLLILVAEPGPPLVDCLGPQLRIGLLGGLQVVRPEIMATVHH